LILFVTHDVAEALDVADRILVLSTRPATILSDIRLPPHDQRPADWASSLEHSRLESQILQTIKGARDPGSFSVRV
jgi:NitT/TauT family transport system ATP-binding protein